MPNIVASLLGKDLFAGRTQQFKAPTMGQALQSPATEQTRASGVMDTHMGDIYGMTAARAKNPSKYYAMVAHSRAVAQKLGMDTRDVQAAQWATKLSIQNLMGETPTAPAGKILDRLTPDVLDSYKKDLVDIFQTDEEVRRMLRTTYGQEFLTKLDAGLAKIPKTAKPGRPAADFTSELTPLVERLRPQYGKPVEEGETSFDFGANVREALGGEEPPKK
jgi:hypothetical protein